MKGVRLLLAFILAVLGSYGTAAAQQVVVHGTVLDASEQPVPGAKVTVKGTATSATADAAGAFDITVPNVNVTLVVAFPGLTTSEIALGGRTNVVVHLSASAVALEGLVVVGYGTQAKSDVTGSVATVSAQRLEDKAATTIEQALEGTVPGVSISTGGGGAEPNTNILIRGRNSLTASNAPLIVLDGIPYEGSLAEIDQNAVATISVLKDASATAIYGSRGSNGVILITTKKGGGAPIQLLGVRRHSADHQRSAGDDGAGVRAVQVRPSQRRREL